jgi:hypothetical protein
VLKGVGERQARLLEEVFGVHTLRELVNHPVLDWVWRTFSTFRAGALKALPPDAPAFVSEPWQGRSCGEWLASPLHSLQAISAEDALRLGEGLRWVTVRDLASDTVCEAARAIHKAATGGPVPPEDTIAKPLPEYFAGATRRYRERVGEVAGRPVPPAPPAAPPPPAAVTPTAPLRTSPLAAELGAMPPRHRHRDYSATGTYMP